MALPGKALLLGLAIGLAGVVLSATPAGLYLEEEFGLAWLFDLRGPKPAPEEVVIVGIDKESAGALSLPNKPSEWPRDLHARLTESLAKAGARVIVFDLTFEKPRTAQQDEPFAAAIRNAGNVVLVESLKRETVPLANLANLGEGAASIEKVVPPIPALAEAALALAPFPLPKVPVRVDRFWTFKGGAGDDPTLPVVAFQVYALEAYEELHAVLRAANPALAQELPVGRSEVLGRLGVAGLAHRLRDALLGHPETVQQMRSMVEQNSAGLDVRKKRLINSLLGVYPMEEMLFLDYYGPARSIRTVPYHKAVQALQAGSGVSDFEGKAVFLGASPASQPDQDEVRDSYHTVFSLPDGYELNGVEIAATAFANLLDNSPIRRLPAAADLGIVFLWGVLLGAIWLLLSTSVAAALSAALVMAYLFAAHLEFGHAALWLPLVVPLCVQVPLTLASGVFIKYREAKLEREVIHEMFGRFLPRSVVDQLVRTVGPITSHDQLVYGVCLATDAAQYTAIAEGTDPQKLRQLMNDYYAALFRPVEDNGGIVSDVIGDAMLAYWAAGSPDAILRKQACETALGVARAAEEFNRAQKAQLPTRIGLHAGKMSLGAIGASKHYEYRAVGDIVNTASRIQLLNKLLGTRILVSEEALEGVEGLVTRPLGSFLLPGKSAPVAVHELIGFKHDVSPDQVWLSSTFASALDSYRRGEWKEAESGFVKITQRLPDDGPTRFYLAKSQEYERGSPTGEWEAVVRVAG